MDFLKQWTFCVCTALCAAVVFSLFTPKGKMKSFYKLLISLFVFISFLYPFKDFKGFSFENPFINNSVIEEQSESPYEAMLNKQITEALSEKGINGAVVESRVSVDYSTDEITVEEVTVAVNKEYDLTETENIIYNAFGIKARVVYSGN